MNFYLIIKINYILSILAHFYKFGANYIINNKEKTAVLSKIKELIFKYGYPEKILTDNGWEFTNKKFIKFFKKRYNFFTWSTPVSPNTKGCREL